MMLSGHQPVYLPGLILFNKIALSDVFMFVGHCQYSPKSWQTRNVIRSGMLSVPVHKDLGQSIDETEAVNGNWRRKHIRNIELTYSKRPFFKEYFSQLADLIEFGETRLGNFNEAIIIWFLDCFEINTPIVRSQDFAIDGHKTDMLISMCKAVGASEYLSNEGARDYVDEGKMAEVGIRHRWQEFTHPVYEQGHREFVSNLSAIDLLFNCGPESGKIIRGAGHAA